MPAKRKSKKSNRSTGSGFAARSGRSNHESGQAGAPIVPPVGRTPLPPIAAARKAGPVIRNGGGPAGVGRGQGAASARRYAFRRS